MNADEPGNQLAQENGTELSESAINREDTAAANPAPDQATEATISKTGQASQTGRVQSDYQVSEPAGSVLAENVKAAESLLSEPVLAAESLLSEYPTDDRPLLAEPAIAEGSLPVENRKTVEMSAEMNLPDNPIELRLIDDADTRLKLKPKKALKDLIDIPREKMTTTIMTGFSGMMASIENSKSTAQGVSFGFYVEQQLTRRISVRPGLAMAKHNYAMESISGGSVALDYDAPELNGISDATTLFEGDIEVVAMEMPVNFVFSLRKRSRSNLFVSTGASTVIYLNQHLSGNFNNTYTRSTVDAYTGEVSYESMTTSVQIESEQEPLNRVDLLGLANFSAGYSIPFGRTSHLLFEPFIQLPLKDLTSLNMRIRYGGLSMKVQF